MKTDIFIFCDFYWTGEEVITAENAMRLSEINYSNRVGNMQLIKNQPMPEKFKTGHKELGRYEHKGRMVIWMLKTRNQNVFA